MFLADVMLVSVSVTLEELDSHLGLLTFSDITGVSFFYSSNTNRSTYLFCYDTFTPVVLMLGKVTIVPFA